MSNTVFKEIYNLALVNVLADRCADVIPDFPSTSFVKEVSQNLEQLEMKERIQQIADGFNTFLGADYLSALETLLEVSNPRPQIGLEEMRGFEVWPLCHYVEEHGLDHFEESIAALYKWTKQFTSEVSIRQFLIKYQEKTLEVLEEWVHDPDENVRRLVSEGTRPRLPWACRLPHFQKDPLPVIHVLKKLKSDSSLYVRRSVANNLNDIAKDHPDLVVETIEDWFEVDDADRMWLIKHACRSLIKKGHPKVLTLLGYTENPEIQVEKFVLTPEKMSLGETLLIELNLKSQSDKEQKLVIDYKVHQMKANGKLAPKVFKWTTRNLEGNKDVLLIKKHKIIPVTTRRYYSGQHLVELMINGVSYGIQEFFLSV
ncbi:MAG: DNA alkylation repair protein [Sedimenticola sp.]